MNRKLLITYKSVTGFTKAYAEMIAQELSADCTLTDLKETTAEIMSGFDTVIFGGRMHAGTVDGLKKAKELFHQSRSRQFLVYATGAMPDNAKETVDQMWRMNLTSDELTEIPHFYMPGGLCYEKMPFLDKMMMKLFAASLKRKKNKTEYEEKSAEAISASYDISSRKYIMPLIAYLNADAGA